MSISEMAKRIYETDLKAELQREHRGSFVAIEPESRDYYVGETFLAAALAAKQAHPNRTPFVLRIGYDAAVHLGGCSQ